MTTHVYQHTGNEGGFERFECPECGRVVLQKFNPFDRVVLVEGDVMAAHSGGFALAGLEMTVKAEIKQDGKL